MINTNKLCKDYQTGSELVHALKNADIECMDGTVTLFMGPSGSGKSTALKILGGLLNPSCGEVFVENYKVHEMTEDDLCEYRYKDVGIVFQNYMVLEHLNVWDNVLLALRAGDTKNKEKESNYYNKAEELLKSLGIYELKNRKASDLSGGQLQRVAIARALVKSPSVLLADEPTANLDTESAVSVISLFSKLTKENNTTTIIATHDERLADYADAIYDFQDGFVKIR